MGQHQQVSNSQNKVLHSAILNNVEKSRQSPYSKLPIVDKWSEAVPFVIQPQEWPFQLRQLCKLVYQKHCVTRAPLLLIRSEVALSFNVCQFVSEQGICVT